VQDPFCTPVFAHHTIGNDYLILRSERHISFVTLSFSLLPFFAYTYAFDARTRLVDLRA
jgi:hypothetical protein